MMKKIVTSGFLLLAAAFAAVPAGAQDSWFELLPGVVADRASGRVYSMKPGGGLEAIDVRSGRVLFESPQADKPVALSGRMLVAQRESRTTPGVLEIAFIDTGLPSRTSTIEMALPEDQMALVDDTLGRTFAVTGEVRGGDLLVGWTATRHWASPLPPEEGQKLHDEKRGAALLDMNAGRATPVDPSLLDDEIQLPDAARAFAAEPNLFGPPVRAGALIVSTQMTVLDGANRRIVLKRWKADGSALPDVELFRGEPIVQWPSSDGRHLIISQRVAPGEMDEYLWNIYSLETGARTGQHRNHFSRAFFYVDGPRLIHDVWPFSYRVDGKIVEFSRQVRAVDLASGAILWQRPLRETLYRGPFPP